MDVYQHMYGLGKKKCTLIMSDYMFLFIAEELQKYGKSQKKTSVMH